ncbi:hypothetical protein [Burkholderia gladioli]|uniref:hypothetical protein n=1 Tax=Burkholderia gladioli TaxID=28095 RepID=UPI00164170F5|nr:hypothetical protein [Burkholderia gladioli]
MSESKQQLIAEKERVFDESGALIATVWEKYPNEERLPGESWLEMRERTKSLRDAAAQEAISRARKFSAAPELVEIAIKARAALAAYLDDHPHVSPHDCYATGPKSGDAYHDLVRCPGCCAQEAFTGLIAGIDAALANAGA